MGLPAGEPQAVMVEEVDDGCWRKLKMEEVDGGRWRKLMVEEEEVDGWRKRKLEEVDGGRWRKLMVEEGPPPAPRRRWTSPHRCGEGLGPGWGPWSPPPWGGQGQGGDDQEDAHVPGQALDLLKSGGV